MTAEGEPEAQAQARATPEISLKSNWGDETNNGESGNEQFPVQQFNIAVRTSSEQSAPTGRLTGRLDDDDIFRARERFIPPGCYDDALSALCADRVVILEGPRGSGKRTGSIALLREVTGEPLSVLSPTASLKELAAREYAVGQGYLVMYPDILSHPDADFTWRTVRDQIREAEAWLVVTTPSSDAMISDAVRKVGWEKPDLAKLLAAAGIDCAEIDRAQIEHALPSEFVMDDFVSFLSELAAGKDISVARAVFGEAAHADVGQWLQGDGSRTRRQIAEITALAFLGGCAKRAFGTGLQLLETALDITMPMPVREAGPPLADDEKMPQLGHDMLGGASLISTRSEIIAGSPQQILDFRMAAYRRHVIAELWRRLEVEFWDAVRTWLNVSVKGFGVLAERRRTAVAAAMALLAEVAPEEVEYTFLEPWSKAAQGLGGRVTAVKVLWELCGSEALAPTALRIAVRWARNQHNEQQRATAALAFAGRLGMSYPEEAVEQLWQLVLHGVGDEFEPTLAMAALFADLVHAAHDAKLVLDFLELKYHDPEASHSQRSSALSTIAEVLSAVEYPQERSATFHYLQCFPDEVGALGRLWALALGQRSQRRRMLDAMLDGLHDLVVNGKQADTCAHAMGNSLASALAPNEFRLFEHDLMMCRKRQRARELGSRPTQSDVERENRVDSTTRVLLKPFTISAIEQGK